MDADATIDHFVVAGRTLPQLREAFTAAGFETEYGGEHGNEITHNDVIGFADGSYVELISTVEPGLDSPWWDTEIRRTSGPAAWALSVADIERETERLLEAGFSVDGPSQYSRVKPDGQRIEWQLATVGDRMGIPYPFLIEDVTPREHRVPEPKPEAGRPPVAGIEEVLIGVSSLERWIDSFRALLQAGDPECQPVPDLEARAASFEDSPVTLVAPDGDGPLSERVSTFDRRPIGCLFAPDGARSRDDRSSETTDWFGTEITWLDIDLPGYFGILADPPDE